MGKDLWSLQTHQTGRYDCQLRLEHTIDRLNKSIVNHFLTLLYLLSHRAYYFIAYCHLYMDFLLIYYVYLLQIHRFKYLLYRHSLFESFA